MEFSNHRCNRLRIILIFDTELYFKLSDNGDVFGDSTIKSQIGGVGESGTACCNQIILLTCHNSDFLGLRFAVSGGGNAANGFVSITVVNCYSVTDTIIRVQTTIFGASTSTFSGKCNGIFRWDEFVLGFCFLADSEPVCSIVCDAFFVGNETTLLLFYRFLMMEQMLLA